MDDGGESKRSLSRVTKVLLLQGILGFEVGSMSGQLRQTQVREKPQIADIVRILWL